MAVSYEAGSKSSWCIMANSRASSGPAAPAASRSLATCLQELVSPPMAHSKHISESCSVRVLSVWPARCSESPRSISSVHFLSAASSADVDSREDAVLTTLEPNWLQRYASRKRRTWAAGSDSSPAFSVALAALVRRSALRARLASSASCLSLSTLRSARRCLSCAPWPPACTTRLHC